MMAAARQGPRTMQMGTDRARAAADVDPVALVFLESKAPSPSSGGGGGGGNGQTLPVRHASGIGADAFTLSATPGMPIVDSLDTARDTTPGVVLDALPLASGTFDQLGLPLGGVSFGSSTGPGTGGGVGTGSGTGIGSGRGPGVGPGSGGGIGGGVYRPGGGVGAPRVIYEVRPTYTEDALRRHVQGTVTLQAIVRRDGCATDITVLRSLDAGGLDERAIAAVSQWRFDPGRLAGAPVDVVAIVLVDFWIR